MVFEARVESSITHHAWNADRSQIAVCPNDNTVVVLKKPATEDGAWERVATLREHDELVTGIAWAPRTNRIVTASQDRNAYVWTLQGGEWKPMLVILRIPAAATSVQWCEECPAPRSVHPVIHAARASPSQTARSSRVHAPPTPLHTPRKPARQSSPHGPLVQVAGRAEVRGWQRRQGGAHLLL